MNSRFLCQALPLSKLRFYIPKVLNVPTCDPRCINLHMIDKEICGYFHGHSQLILKATQWIVLSPFYTGGKKKEPKPTKPTLKSEVEWFEEFHTVAVWCGVAWPTCRARPWSSSFWLSPRQCSHYPKTELHIFLRMNLSYPILFLLYLNFSCHSGLVLESFILLLSCLKYPVYRMSSFKNASLLFPSS